MLLELRCYKFKLVLQLQDVKYNLHGNNKESIYRRYTKGTEKRIKTIHYKDQQNAKEESNAVNEEKKAIRHLENVQQKDRSSLSIITLNEMN